MAQQESSCHYKKIGMIRLRTSWLISYVRWTARKVPPFYLPSIKKRLHFVACDVIRKVQNQGGKLFYGFGMDKLVYQKLVKLPCGFIADSPLHPSEIWFEAIKTTSISDVGNVF